MKPRNWTKYGESIDYLSNGTIRRNSGLILSKSSLQCPTANNGDKHRPTNFSFTKLETQSMTGTQYWNQIGSPRRTSGVIFELTGIPFVPVVNEDGVYNSCVSDVFGQMRGGLDLGIDLSQSSQTVGMVKGIGKLTSMAKGWRRIASEISGKTLEFQYGWKPTMQSIFDCMDQLMNQGLEGNITSYKARAQSVLGPFKNTAPQGYVRYEWMESSRCELKIRMWPPYTAVQRLGLYTSLNPATFLWEHIPYSFVVDWVYNVGNYIRDLETTLIYSTMFESGYITRTFEQSGAMQGHVIYNPPGSYNSGEGDWRYVSKGRSVLTALPYPHKPVLDVKLGWQRLMNGAALLGNAFNKRGK